MDPPSHSQQLRREHSTRVLSEKSKRNMEWGEKKNTHTHSRTHKHTHTHTHIQCHNQTCWNEYKPKCNTLLRVAQFVKIFCVNIVLIKPHSDPRKHCYTTFYQIRFLYTFLTWSVPSRFLIHLISMGRTPKKSWFDSRQGQKNHLFPTASRPTMSQRPQPTTQWITRPLSSGDKQPGREADHSSLF
jgi:hypothetical protein